MPTVKELLRAGRKEELWQMCCGFLDLNIEQFMSIQKRLLLEQIELLNDSIIGKKIMGDSSPKRRRIQEKGAADNLQGLLPRVVGRREEPCRANRCTGSIRRAGLLSIPSNGKHQVGAFDAGMCEELANWSRRCHPGKLQEKGRCIRHERRAEIYLCRRSQAIYIRHICLYSCEEIGGISLPPLEIAEKLDIEERIALSFKLALSEGLDFYFGVTVALVAIGEKINQQMGKVNIKSLLSQPKALAGWPGV